MRDICVDHLIELPHTEYNDFEFSKKYIHSSILSIIKSAVITTQAAFKAAEATMNASIKYNKKRSELEN